MQVDTVAARAADGRARSVSLMGPIGQVLEFDVRQIIELAAEDKVEQLRGCLFGNALQHATRSVRSSAIYEDAIRRSLRRSMSAACLSRPAATSIPCRVTGRL